SYFGKETEKPTIGDKIKDFELEDIKKNIKIMYVTSFLSLVIFSLIFGIISLI
ncbi:MAG: adenosylcobinamide-phosphate synthase, partial [Pseudoleptotrichia goodfellowii]|nr:adenosylcobinamide-phosphate synthase [Pseudoleptotrichia goodfellowii]